jgi:2-polyprenyl-3-methyl-5-hydroxy-6-metoxy-1,4-benzoquinol methylase
MSKNYLKLLEESLPPPNHKMYDLWKQYALDAVKRGFVVKKIVSRFVDFSQGKILDIGCGEGGITIAFAKCETDVCSVDIDRKRVYRSKVRAHEEGCAYVNFVIADGSSYLLEMESLMSLYVMTSSSMFLNLIC